MPHAQAGKIRVWCLGIGLDALNYVADVLTVAIFDADVFDEVFDGLVESNEEGTVTGNGGNEEQYAFDSETVERLLANEPMAPSGAACLSLAWKHREALR